MSPTFLFLLTSAFDNLLKIVVVLGILFLMCIMCMLTISIFIFVISILFKVLAQRNLPDSFQNFLPYDYRDLREAVQSPFYEEEAGGGPAVKKMTIVESEELDRLAQEDKLLNNNNNTEIKEWLDQTQKKL